MDWLPLALASPALLTIVNFVDKYIVEREVPDHQSMPIFAGVAGALVAVVMALLGLGSPLPTQDAIIVLIAGILVVVGATFYFRAIVSEQASTLIILFQIAPLFVLILAWIILHETISLHQFAGFWLILAAALGISIERGAGKLRLSLALGLILIVDLINAVSSILLRGLSVQPSFSTLAIYQGVGQGIGAVLIYLTMPPFRRGFNRTLAEMRKPALGIIAFNESLFLAARALFNQALTLGPAALVSVLSGTQAFYGILFGWALTLIAPQTFRESIGRADLARKLVMAALLFAGLWLVIVSDA